MKISKEQLRKIIREEVQKSLKLSEAPRRIGGSGAQSKWPEKQIHVVKDPEAYAKLPKLDDDDESPGPVRQSFRNADLQGQDLRGEALVRADLYAANLEGANLEDVDLTKAFMTEAKISSANLQGADLHAVEARYVRGKGADLRGANLVHTDFSYANLQGADFTGANIANTAFSFGDLRGAKFTTEMKGVAEMWNTKVTEDQVQWFPEEKRRELDVYSNARSKTPIRRGKWGSQR